MSEEAKPCALCGKLPGLPEIYDGYSCQTHDCPMGYCTIPCPHNWNYLQNLALHQRRKDFEAGFAEHAIRCEMAMGNGGMCADQSEADSVFADYLATQQGKSEYPRE